MPDTTPGPLNPNAPTINLEDFLGAVDNYRDTANAFAQKAGLLWDPIHQAFVQNPNFLTPLQSQQLQQEQLQYKGMTDPNVAAQLAQVQNAGTQATYMDPARQAQASALRTQIAQLTAAVQAAEQLQQHGGTAGYGIGSILSKFGLGSATPYGQAYTGYQQAVGVLPSDLKALFANPGVVSPAYQTTLAGLQQQLQSLQTPQTYSQAAAQPPVGNIPSYSGPMGGSAFGMTAPQAPNPYASGQQAWQGTQQ